MGRGRAPCCDKSKVKKGPWTPAEDFRLITFVQKHGHPNWRSLPLQAGLLRCGKSCRLRWINYLRPDLKRGNFTKQEEETIINLHHSLGNKWSKIAAHFPGRTDNEIKNVWNTHLKKRLLIKKKDDEEDIVEAKQFSETSSPSSSVSFMSPMGNPDILQKGQEGDEPKQASISTSSSISSYASDYYSHPNGVDNHNHIPMPEKELGSFFNNNSDDQLVIEIPMESDTNFWDILDNLDTSNLQSNEYSQTQEEFEPLQDSNFGEDQCDREIDEYGKWFRYLENELGLESTSYWK